MKRPAMLAALAIASVTGQVRADEVDNDGNFLLQSCSAVERFEDGDARDVRVELEDTRHVWSCYSYVDGVLDTAEFVRLARGGKKPYCYPDGGLQRRQIARVIAKYLRDNPKQLHSNASGLVLVAMTEAFPCKGAKL